MLNPVLCSVIGIIWYNSITSGPIYLETNVSFYENNTFYAHQYFTLMERTGCYAELNVSGSWNLTDDFMAVNVVSCHDTNCGACEKGTISWTGILKWLEPIRCSVFEITDSNIFTIQE